MDLESADVSRIRELYVEGLSKRQIQLQVFGYDGGQAARAVREALGGDTTGP